MTPGIVIKEVEDSHLADLMNINASLTCLQLSCDYDVLLFPGFCYNFISLLTFVYACFTSCPWVFTSVCLRLCEYFAAALHS